MIEDVSYVFGGYRTVTFSLGSAWRVDNDAFLFRLLEAGHWSPVVCKVKQGNAHAVDYVDHGVEWLFNRSMMEGTTGRCLAAATICACGTPTTTH